MIDIIKEEEKLYLEEFCKKPMITRGEEIYYKLVCYWERQMKGKHNEKSRIF